jgi:hypothetical protein
MANYGGYAKSVAFNNGSVRTISSIKSYEVEPLGSEPVAFRDGTSRIEGHYQGSQTGSVQVEITDVDWLKSSGGLKKGDVVTAVVLTIAGAIDSAGSASNADLTVTMSRAVIEEIGPLGKDSEDGTPATVSIRFRLSAAAGAAAPTMVIAGGT